MNVRKDNKSDEKNDNVITFDNVQELKKEEDNTQLDSNDEITEIEVNLKQEDSNVNMKRNTSLSSMDELNDIKSSLNKMLNDLNNNE
tara:strand:+ start:841 stop:1101 length:261 start_codon:yes stop_codon:yes gene_type:complete